MASRKADVTAAAVRRHFPGPLTHEALLGVVVLVELGYFAAAGSNFLSAGNAAEVARASVEIGLLALALTPVIVTGGIDLSVGSLLGLAAVLMGAMYRDLGLPMGAAALVGVLVGVAGGALNALLVTRLGVPPLIATLGTYSLFRGVAEGFTGGVRNYTDFPAGFLFLGQGRLPGGVPAQLPLLLAAAIFFWLLLHRTPAGRGLRAIGFSPDGARYAGIPVARRLALVYVLSGLMAGMGAAVYAARLGQAKADAGTGFELFAITAVVLGGTSIFGGRGSVPGTLLGLLAVALLQNGLRLSDLPAELAGILTGVMLIAAIGAHRVFSERSRG
ncbi:MAG TPA: ABC transporter permease [Vicinamibacteria bacterium]|nr:ABC transporter permease [Vicinamibacteria bacterium]